MTELLEIQNAENSNDSLMDELKASCDNIAQKQQSIDNTIDKVEASISKFEYDVLVWNSPKSKHFEKDDPYGLDNVSEEHTALTEYAAWKIYDNCKYYHKQIIRYSKSEDFNQMSEDGDILAEESNEDALN
jgi:hypothetical protein